MVIQLIPPESKKGYIYQDKNVSPVALYVWIKLVRAANNDFKSNEQLEDAFNYWNVDSGENSFKRSVTQLNDLGYIKIKKRIYVFPDDDNHLKAETGEEWTLVSSLEGDNGN